MRFVLSVAVRVPCLLCAVGVFTALLPLTRVCAGVVAFLAFLWLLRAYCALSVRAFCMCRRVLGLFLFFACVAVCSACFCLCALLSVCARVLVCVRVCLRYSGIQPGTQPGTCSTLARFRSLHNGFFWRFRVVCFRALCALPCFRSRVSACALSPCCPPAAPSLPPCCPPAAPMLPPAAPLLLPCW